MFPRIKINHFHKHAASFRCLLFCRASWSPAFALIYFGGNGRLKITPRYLTTTVFSRLNDVRNEKTVRNIIGRGSVEQARKGAPGISLETAYLSSTQFHRRFPSQPFPHPSCIILLPLSFFSPCISYDFLFYDVPRFCRRFVAYCHRLSNPQFSTNSTEFYR